MALILSEFSNDPQILTPTGGAVRLFFTANATSSGPSQMQARFSIDPTETFVFALPSGATTKEVFFPAANQRIAAPTSSTPFGPIPVTIAPEGQPDPTHVQPLQINLELQGFDAAGNRTSDVRNRVVLITMDTSSFALGLLTASLGISHKELANSLGVHPSTVTKVMEGGSSAKVREALAKILRGQ